MSTPAKTIQPPAPDEIKAERVGAGLTQEQAAQLVYSVMRTWRRWETGDSKMPTAIWEIFKIKVAGDGKNKIGDMPIQSPTTQEIKDAREAAGLTQTEAAAVVNVELRGWQRWEGGERVMNPAILEFFKIKTAQ